MKIIDILNECKSSLKGYPNPVGYATAKELVYRYENIPKDREKLEYYKEQIENKFNMIKKDYSYKFNLCVFVNFVKRLLDDDPSSRKKTKKRKGFARFGGRDIPGQNTKR